MRRALHPGRIREDECRTRPPLTVALFAVALACCAGLVWLLFALGRVPEPAVDATSECVYLGYGLSAMLSDESFSIVELEGSDPVFEDGSEVGGLEEGDVLLVSWGIVEPMDPPRVSCSEAVLVRRGGEGAAAPYRDALARYVPELRVLTEEEAEQVRTSPGSVDMNTLLAYFAHADDAERRA